MYSVLIVDDEVILHDKVKSLIDWNASGFFVCGETVGDKNALQMLLSLQPDLTLINIHMPKVQGMQLLKAAREQNFKGKFVIISDYSGFKLAQEAIRYKADAYLTKPISATEFSETIARIKDSLDMETNKEYSIEYLNRKACQVILQELTAGTCDIYNNLSSEDIQKLGFDSDVYQIVIFEKFSQFKSGMDYNFVDLFKIINKDEHTLSYSEENGKQVILLKGTYALTRFKDFLKHYNKTNPPQKGSLMDMFFLTYGRPVYTLTDIHFSYEDALKLHSRRFFCDQEQHTSGYEELYTLEQNIQHLSTEMLSKYTDSLVDYLQTFNRKNVSTILHKLENDLHRVENNVQEIKLFLTDLYLRIKEKISLTYNTMIIPFAANSDVIRFISEKYYLYEIIWFFQEHFEMIMNATSNPNHNSVLDDILDYIDHNYWNNIKLENIAPLFGYNSAYLGKIFNKKVGESFNSYVDHVRIEHAKQLLLHKNYKVFEIAEKVGYRNVDYFHKKFRKYVGESPAEFRKLNRMTTAK